MIMSQEPVTLDVGDSGERIIAFLTVSAGMPVISARNVDEKSISGEMEVTAALSLGLVQSLRLTYTHQTKERICPRSAGV